MNCKHSAVIAVIFIASTISASAEPVVKLEAIAGKTPEDITKVLGKPTRETKTKYRSDVDGIKYAPTAEYKEGKIEVVFINGKADWITIDMSGISFDIKAIEALGLKLAPPTFANANVIRWEPHRLYNSVSIFPQGNGKVDYAYIKVATK